MASARATPRAGAQRSPCRPWPLRPKRPIHRCRRPSGSAPAAARASRSSRRSRRGAPAGTGPVPGHFRLLPFRICTRERGGCYGVTKPGDRGSPNSLPNCSSGDAVAAIRGPPGHGGSALAAEEGDPMSQRIVRRFIVAGAVAAVLTTGSVQAQEGPPASRAVWEWLGSLQERAALTLRLWAKGPAPRQAGSVSPNRAPRKQGLMIDPNGSTAPSPTNPTGPNG
jgi:hypothetical protein